MKDQRPFQHVALDAIQTRSRRLLARRWLGELVLFGFVALLCGVLLCAFVREKSGLNSNHKALFVDMIDGTAHRPYVQRVLVPWLVNAVADSFSQQERAEFDAAIKRRPQLTRALNAMVHKWNRDYLLEYVTALALMYVALLGFAYALRYLTAAFYRGPPGGPVLVQLFGLVALVPFFETYASYLYDFPQLCLMTLALGAMVRRSWSLYLPVFFLACLNKETAVLLGLVYALYFALRPQLRASVYFTLGVVQLVLYVAVKVWITSLYAGNPGTGFEDHLARNVMWLPRYSLGSLFSFLAVVFLVAHRWSVKPLFLRVALVMFVPLFTLTFFFGYLDELRDYYEVYPVVLLLGAQSFAELLGRPLVRA